MFKEDYFDLELDLSQEDENLLELENWMVEESVFRVDFFQIILEIENPLEIEDWMINEKNWNQNK